MFDTASVFLGFVIGMFVGGMAVLFGYLLPRLLWKDDAR